LDAAGVSYDGALPQSFFDALMRASGKNPIGHIVYAYTDQNRFGVPVAVDVDGAFILADWVQSEHQNNQV
jgi:hypothetical protein